MTWFDQLLIRARQEKISDIHLKEDLPPIFRRPHGLEQLSSQPLLRGHLEQLIQNLLSAEAYHEFLEAGESDLAYSGESTGRVRINIYKDRGRLSLAIRLIPLNPPRIPDLGLPAQVSKLATFPDGLVIVAGPTGSGKSTTLAAVVQEINHERAQHIVTIEDPIEYMYDNKRSVISQREVGSDTRSFHEALRRVLRQDPDTIVIGESRDRETIRTALAAAETGHLVFTTLHTVSARETIGRILEMFPADQHEQIRHILAGVLQAVVVQRILPRSDNGGRVVVQEIMFASGRVREAISDPSKTSQLDEIIADSRAAYGMQTFNQALVDLVVEGKISEKTAMSVSQVPQDLRLKLHAATGEDPTVAAARARAGDAPAADGSAEGSPGPTLELG